MAMRKEIFISHRSTDRRVVDELNKLMQSCGIHDKIFYTSSYSTIQRITYEVEEEIQEALATSKLNIVVLSEEYFKSTYCIEEWGAIKLSKTPKILISLLDYDQEEKLKSKNIIRRLDREEDVYTIIEILKEMFPAEVNINGLHMKRIVDELLKNINCTTEIMEVNNMTNLPQPRSEVVTVTENKKWGDEYREIMEPVGKVADVVLDMIGLDEDDKKEVRDIGSRIEEGAEAVLNILELFFK